MDVSDYFEYKVSEQERQLREQARIDAQEKLDQVKEGESAQLLLSIAHHELNKSAQKGELSNDGSEARSQISIALRVMESREEENKQECFNKAQEHTKNAALILSKEKDNTENGSLTEARLLCNESASMLESYINPDFQKEADQNKLDRPYSELSKEQVENHCTDTWLWNDRNVHDGGELKFDRELTEEWDYEVAHAASRLDQLDEELEIRSGKVYEIDNFASFVIRGGNEQGHER